MLIKRTLSDIESKNEGIKNLFPTQLNSCLRNAQTKQIFSQGGRELINLSGNLKKQDSSSTNTSFKTLFFGISNLWR